MYLKTWLMDLGWKAESTYYEVTMEQYCVVFLYLNKLPIFFIEITTVYLSTCQSGSSFYFNLELHLILLRRSRRRAGSPAPRQLLGNGPSLAPCVTHVFPPDEGRRDLVVEANAHHTHTHSCGARWPDKRAAAPPITGRKWQTHAAKRGQINMRLGSSVAAEHDDHRGATRPRSSECSGSVWHGERYLILVLAVSSDVPSVR